MLSRLISRPSNLRFLTLISSNSSLHFLSSPPQSSQPLLCKPNFRFILETSRYFSSNKKDSGGDTGADPSISNSWKISPENDDGESIFGDDGQTLTGITDGDVDFDARSGKASVVGSVKNDESWLKDSSVESDIFGEIDKEFRLTKGGEDDEWKTVEGYKPWSFVDEEKGEVFDAGDGSGALPSVEDKSLENEKSDVDEQLEREEEELSVQLKGPNRAFGDLIAASGITDAMLDSLIVLKDLEHVEGLPPLREIEDLRLEKNERKSTRAEMERKKQEEVAKARVRQVDEKGRAYGTGKRKCSVARVWIQPGDGKFIVNDKQFDVYFPMLDQRADLLRPFAETRTLGLWDVNCTVKGGGFSGQVGAVRLGISRALQNWEPGLRPQLRSAGFLTRDSRVVERKKPGKAKARKSFQWVKR